MSKCSPCVWGYTFFPRRPCWPTFDIFDQLAPVCSIFPNFPLREALGNWSGRRRTQTSPTPVLLCVHTPPVFLPPHSWKIWQYLVHFFLPQMSEISPHGCVLTIINQSINQSNIQRTGWNLCVHPQNLFIHPPRPGAAGRVDPRFTYTCGIYIGYIVSQQWAQRSTC